MYDLQKTILDNYVKKYNIEVIKKELKDNGKTWFYFLKPYKEDNQTVYPFITAKMIFPETFYDKNNINFESTFNEYN